MKDESSVDADEYRGQIRLPAKLADRVKAAAVADHRSMNKMITVLLERALPTNEKAETAVTVPAE